MVRLEVVGVYCVIVGAGKFQFHDGTIRSCPAAGCILLYQEFQFHDGTIRREWKESLSGIPSDFNSTMVRLEVTSVLPM